MNSRIRILGISGSLRQGSYNGATLRAAMGLAPAGVVIDPLELHGIPLFNQDEERNPPAAVLELKQRVREADGVLFVTPEYNFSLPGVLKNAIDWGSRPFDDNAWDGKPAAIMGASLGAIGTARAQYHLRQICVLLNVFPVNRPEVLIGNAAQRFDAQGNLTDEATKDHIRQLLENLVDLIQRIGRPSTSAQAGERRSALTTTTL